MLGAEQILFIFKLRDRPWQVDVCCQHVEVGKPSGFLNPSR